MTDSDPQAVTDRASSSTPEQSARALRLTSHSLSVPPRRLWFERQPSRFFRLR